MKLIVKGAPKEIAALVVEIQERRETSLNNEFVSMLTMKKKLGQEEAERLSRKILLMGQTKT